MRIRRAQLDALQADADEAFVEAICRYFDAEQPHLFDGLPPELWRERVRVGVARGRGHGITVEAPLVTFVALMLEFSPTFDEHPPFRRILEDPGTRPDDRLDVLLEESTDADWEEVEARADEAAWTSPGREG